MYCIWTLWISNPYLDSVDVGSIWIDVAMEMLSGSLFNDKAAFTVPVHPFRRIFELGYALKKGPWRIAFIYFNRTPDNKLQAQESHHYLNITLSRFFDSFRKN